MKATRLFGILISGAIILLTGCGGGGGSDTPCIAGTWKLLSVTAGTTTVQCPGSDAAAGLICGENETLTLNANGLYTDTHLSTPDDSGTWFVHDGVDSDIVVFDDDMTPNNPYSYNFVLEGNLMHFSTTQGYIKGVYELVSRDETCDGPSTDYEDHDRNLVGTWRLVSLWAGSTTVTCPGSNEAAGIACGENETITYTGNGRFTDTHIMTPDDSGIWFTNNNNGKNILVNDDDATPDNPSAYIYTLDGNSLQFTTMGGYTGGNYVKVE